MDAHLLASLFNDHIESVVHSALTLKSLRLPNQAYELTDCCWEMRQEVIHNKFHGLAEEVCLRARKKDVNTHVHAVLQGCGRS